MLVVSVILLLLCPCAVIGTQCEGGLCNADQLEWDLWLPGSEEYEKRRELKNTLFSSRPAAIITVRTVEDVKEAIQLAHENGVRPTVSSSRHDYIGRCTGVDSLQIDMSEMNGISVNPDDPESETGASALIETACEWGDVYIEVDKYDLLAVGGSAQTVTPGGYIQGGGHSPVGRYLGMGVDSVLGINMVTVDGEYIHVNASGVTSHDDPGKMFDDDGELFWAIRGGGGGTFGFVISFKVKLFQPPEGFTLFNFISAIRTSLNGDVGQEVVDVINNWYHDNIDDGKIGGYLITSSGPCIPITSGCVFFTSLYAGPYEEAYPVYEPLMNYNPEFIFVKEQYNFSTFLEYKGNETDPTGFPVYLINRFIQPDDLVNPAHSAAITTSLLDRGIYLACTGAMIGGRSRDIDDDSAATSPAFRHGAFSTSCGTAWEDPSDDATNDYFIQGVKRYAEDLYQHGEGLYLNEPDRDYEDWKVGYWGSMEVYDRLLAVKQKWDPENVLWCHHCVGSDLVDPSERLLLHKSEPHAGDRINKGGE